MRVRRHGQSTVRPTLTYCILTNKKTGTPTNVPTQPHVQRHCRHRMKKPKQPLRLSPSKKMNSALKKIIVAATGDQWIKGEKYMVMGYTNKYFVELMDRIYGWYSEITPGYLMGNQDNTQAAYNYKYPI